MKISAIIVAQIYCLYNVFQDNKLHFADIGVFVK